MRKIFLTLAIATLSSIFTIAHAEDLREHYNRLESADTRIKNKQEYQMVLLSAIKYKGFQISSLNLSIEAPKPPYAAVSNNLTGLPQYWYFVSDGKVVCKFDMLLVSYMTTLIDYPAGTFEPKDFSSIVNQAISMCLPISSSSASSSLADTYEKALEHQSQQMYLTEVKNALTLAGINSNTLSIPLDPASRAQADSSEGLILENEKIICKVALPLDPSAKCLRK